MLVTAGLSTPLVPLYNIIRAKRCERSRIAAYYRPITLDLGFTRSREHIVRGRGSQLTIDQLLSTSVLIEVENALLEIENALCIFGSLSRKWISTSVRNGFERGRESNVFWQIIFIFRRSSFLLKCILAAAENCIHWQWLNTQTAKSTYVNSTTLRRHVVFRGSAMM